MTFANKDQPGTSLLVLSLATVWLRTSDPPNVPHSKQPRKLEEFFQMLILYTQYEGLKMDNAQYLFKTLQNASLAKGATFRYMKIQ